MLEGVHILQELIHLTANEQTTGGIPMHCAGNCNGYLRFLNT